MAVTLTLLAAGSGQALSADPAQIPGSSASSNAAAHGDWASETATAVRRCSAFRPDRRYGDRAENIRTTRVACPAAKSILRIFHNYDRDSGAYRPAQIRGFSCRVRARSGTPIDDGVCVSGSRTIRWHFVIYTG
ncbi:hypothetical protein [Miltoncostaea oceani]|uniref:hypothetical protein n=1 Tax=Miltoncostaea oceani TaxID=2843216 RepID=UPI001C3C6B15|nr:hypothetical protein [Miltoncostaea oceani]